MTGIDWSKCAICETDPEKMGGAYTVRALRMSADSIVENYESGGTPEDIVQWFELPVKDVREIIEYACARDSSLRVVHAENALSVLR